MSQIRGAESEDLDLDADLSGLVVTSFLSSDEDYLVELEKGTGFVGAGESLIFTKNVKIRLTFGITLKEGYGYIHKQLQDTLLQWQEEGTALNFYAAPSKWSTLTDSSGRKIRVPRVDKD